MSVSFSQEFIFQYLAREGHLLNLHTLIKVPLTNGFTVKFSKIKYFKCLYSDFANAYYKKTEKKKTRKSRGLEMFSDIENLDVKLGERHSEREESVNSNSARRPGSTDSNMSENNEENLYLNHSETGFGNNANQDTIQPVAIQTLRSIDYRVS